MVNQQADKGSEPEFQGIGRCRAVESTDDIDEGPLKRETAKNGPAWIKAQSAFIDSLKRTAERLKAERAREASIKAADEAGIFTRNRN